MALAKKTITLKRVTEERAKKQENTTSAGALQAPSSTIKYDKEDSPEPVVFTYDFGAALSLLKLGKSMARKCWKPGRYIQMSTSHSKSFIAAPFLFYHSGSSNANVVWTPSCLDIFATDWIEFVPSDGE